MKVLHHVAGLGISTRHGEICLNRGGRSSEIGLNRLTGSRRIGKHISKSMLFFFFLINDRKGIAKFCSRMIWHFCFMILFNEPVKNSCLDEVAEIASLPSFDGCLGEIKISGTSY